MGLFTSKVGRELPLYGFRLQRLLAEKLPGCSKNVPAPGSDEFPPIYRANKVRNETWEAFRANGSFRCSALLLIRAFRRRYFSVDY